MFYNYGRHGWCTFHCCIDWLFSGSDGEGNISRRRTIIGAADSRLLVGGASQYIDSGVPCNDEQTAMQS